MPLHMIKLCDARCARFTLEYALKLRQWPNADAFSQNKSPYVRF